jgi:hypothetical protein
MKENEIIGSLLDWLVSEGVIAESLCIAPIINRAGTKANGKLATANNSIFPSPKYTCA